MEKTTTNMNRDTRRWTILEEAMFCRKNQWQWLGRSLRGEGVNGSSRASSGKRTKRSYPTLPSGGSGETTGEDQLCQELDQSVHSNDFVNQGNIGKPCPVDGCSQKLSSEEDLANHLREHPMPCVCGVCKRLYMDRTLLRRHFRVHAGERPFECATCKKQFSQSANLKLHQRFHAAEKQNVCRSDKKYTAPSTLAAHERTHTVSERRHSAMDDFGEDDLEEKPVAVCGKFQEPARRRSQRVISHKFHGGKEINEEPADGDMEGSSNPQNDERSEKLSHTPVLTSGETTEEDQLCQELDQSVHSNDFVNQGNIGKPCPVDGCSQKLSSEEDLANHLREHPMPCVCGVCKRLYLDRTMLRRHFRVHTGERPFECATCKKLFSQSANLKLHQRFHMTTM